MSFQNDAYAAMIARRDDKRKLMNSRTRDEVDSSETTNDAIEETKPVPIHALSSLHEEDQAADSDESGYVEASPKSSMDRTELKSHKSEEANNNNQVTDHAEFIKCPISETIKKLANASLRSSKTMRVSTTNACIESLSGGVNRTEIDGESPSLLQRKRLLAQHGVMV